MLHRTLKPAFRGIVSPTIYEWMHDLKVRAAHWRRLLMRQDPLFRLDTKVPVERHGDWFVCPAGLTASSIVYSLGIGRDVSFDLSMIVRFGVDVHAFDPTPSALEWLRHQTFPGQFRMMEFGVAGFDGEAEFSPPEDAGNPSFGYRGRSSEGKGAVICQVRRLASLMQMLDHSEIDLLKMDIEGAEYEVIEDLVSSGVRVNQLLVEFHHRKPGMGAGKTRQAVAQLRRVGFELFHMSSSGREMAFIRARERQG